MAPRVGTCPECGSRTVKISWSSLRVHEECKQKGFRQRSGKKASVENQRMYFPGTVTDRVVRDWLLDAPEKHPNAMPDMVVDVVDRELDLLGREGKSLSWRDSTDKGKVVKDCVEAVTRIEHALNELVLPYEYQPDFRFKAPAMFPAPDGSLDRVLLNGAMDIIVKDDKGRWAVYDVKHTRDDSYWRKTLGQLSFYDLSVFLMFGEPTFQTGLFQPLCKERVKLWTLDQEDRIQLLARVARMAEDVWKEDFAPRTDVTICQFCNVKHACSKFAPVVSSAGKKIAPLL